MQQQQQYEKNPNGGYLNPSKFGGHWGTMDITPQLLAAIQQTGKVEIKISQEKMNQKGEPYIRITAKPYDDSWRTAKAGQQNPAGYAQPVAQPQYQQPAQGGYVGAPATQLQQDPLPVAPAPIQSDESPF